MPDARVHIVEPDARVNVVEVDSGAIVIELGTSGPQGPAGSINISDMSYIHLQSVPNNQWIIVHNLNFYPSITVVDSSGNVVEGSYNYQDVNTITISFSGAFSGKAYLS